MPNTLNTLDTSVNYSNKYLSGEKPSKNQQYEQSNNPFL